MNNEVVRFQQGKITDIIENLHRRNESGFDGIIMMDSILEYSGRKSDDIHLLANPYKLASDDCIIVIQNFNREFSLEHYQKYWIESFPSNLVRITKFISKPTSRILEADWEFYRREKDDKSLRHLESVHLRSCLYSGRELKELAQKTRWRFIRCFGSFPKQNSFSPKNDFYVIAVCRK